MPKGVDGLQISRLAIGKSMQTQSVSGRDFQRELEIRQKVQTWAPAREIKRPVLSTSLNRVCHDGRDVTQVHFINGASNPDQAENCIES